MNEYGQSRTADGEWAWDAQTRRDRQRRFDVLATYNAERARGIVHTPEWADEMAELQREFDARRW